MSLYGMMRTGVSGMNGQSNRLSTVSDNIANSDTTGYKRSKTEFATLIIPNAPGTYNSGGITTTIQRQVTQQGALQYTTSTTDLAINGEGFFAVQDADGTTYLTRAGSFVPDGEGRFVNAAGFFLAGYDAADGLASATNGFGGLKQIQLSGNELTTSPTNGGLFKANLPQSAAVVNAADLPSANSATSVYSAKSSIVAYNNLGTGVTVDLYFSKTADNTWEVTAYDKASADPTTGSFPYSAAPLSTDTLNFDPTTGRLDAASADNLSIPIPGGQTMTLDLSEMSQLDSTYTVLSMEVNGNGPSAIEKIEFSDDGTMYARFEDGSRRALYRIPLATVASPDMLTGLPGNVYVQSNNSGLVRLGFPGEGGLGSMISGALENSNVDIAQELTEMIASQRSYTANSKVFQTGADLLDILVNLKR